MGFGFQLTLVLFYSCTSISLSFVPLIPLPKNLLFDCELYRNTQTLLQFWNHLNNILFAISSSWIIQENATKCSLLEIDGFFSYEFLNCLYYGPLCMK